MALLTSTPAVPEPPNACARLPQHSRYKQGEPPPCLSSGMNESHSKRSEAKAMAVAQEQVKAVRGRK
jgi:hypothetical protein